MSTAEKAGESLGGGVRHEGDVDVLIVGAGISGIGAAYYVQRDCPRLTYAIVEAREALGGTWDLFRYPGVRSDSDLYTFGYSFRPWRSDSAIARGADILTYLRDTASEYGIDRHIRYRHRLVRADFSSAEARWRVELLRTDTNTRVSMTCRWLFGAAGYYRYDAGFRPKFVGEERFRGPIVHPQHWPAELDYAGKKVVVIGSGATAMTLIPAMAGTTSHITMLQRTPTYVVSMPSRDAVANGLRKVMPEAWAHALTRRRYLVAQRAIWRACRKYPRQARGLIRHFTMRQLPRGYPVDEHFNPPYDPWDQRLCLVPDGDLFKAISSGQASVVTDHIESFTETGIRLRSGRELAADIIVTATGLALQLYRDVDLTVDGAAVTLSDTVVFKGMMLSGVPNFAFSVGYTQASWTLKVELVCEHLCRLLNHMDQLGLATCRPDLPASMTKTRPALDFGAGYVQRALPELPRQGEAAPWQMPMDYVLDRKTLREGDVADPHLTFTALVHGKRTEEHSMDITQSTPRVPRVRRPEHVQVKPRNLRFRISPNVPKHWFDDDPFMTHFMNALTLTFPRGERSFIESVKAVRDRVKSPMVRADIAGFVGQEALHSREHDALNDVLEGMGYPIHALEKAFCARLDAQERHMSKKSRLAFTAAVEHLTALFGRLLLTNEEIRTMIHPELRAIWMWHALEEIEHKAVAFDVYQDVFDDDTTRRWALVLATGAFLTFTHYAQYQLLKRDGLANNPSVWARGLWKLWGPSGLARTAIPTWVDYLRRDFHPWQEDDSALISDFETGIVPRAVAS